MKKNMGTADRVIRIIIAAIVGVLYFTDLISGTLGIILLVVAGVIAQSPPAIPGELGPQAVLL